MRKPFDCEFRNYDHPDAGDYGYCVENNHQCSPEAEAECIALMASYEAAETDRGDH